MSGWIGKRSIWFYMAIILPGIFLGGCIKKVQKQRTISRITITTLSYPPFFIYPGGIDSTSETPRLWTVVCKYDINGHLIDSINQRDHASFKYNSAGDCTEGYFHHGNGDCIYDETHYCKYDNYHRLIVDSIKSPFNSGKGVTRYSYNSAGKISGMTVHYYSEYPDYTVLYEYDSVSNRTRKSAYENGRLCSLETFAYDAHNQVIQNTYKSMSERGFWISKHQYQYTYNSQNKLVRKLEYRDNPTNNNPETLYNYDMKGSLLVETEFRNSDHDCFAITIYENGLKKELLSYAQNKLRARQIYSYEYW